VHSLEVRTPFLDQKVIEFAASLPMNFKLKGFTATKYLLRKHLSKYFPADIYKRKKQGFNFPLDSWLRGKLKDFVYQILLDSKKNNSGIFNFRNLEQLLNRHQNGENLGNAIWALLAFELWQREHLDV